MKIFSYMDTYVLCFDKLKYLICQLKTFHLVYLNTCISLGEVVYIAKNICTSIVILFISQYFVISYQEGNFYYCPALATSYYHIQEWHVHTIIIFMNIS